jgi:hypothetical protein
VRQALLEPGRLFSSADLTRGAAQLGFAVLTTSVFAAIGQLFGLVARGSTEALVDRLTAQSDTPEMLRQMLQASRHMSTPGATLVSVLFLPAVALLFVYLNAAITHGFAVVLRQSRRGFAATFAACAYSLAPLVLLAIPGCGFFVALIWTVILTGIGLQVVHGIKPAGAAATVLAPYLLACCFGCAASVMLGAALRSGIR